jgi:hypothetical protein
MKKALHPLTHPAASPARLHEPPETEIQKTAYYLWQQKGCPDGCDLDIWLEARELLRHHAAVPAATAAAPARVMAPKPTVQIHFPGPHSTAPFPPAGPGPASTHLDFRHALTP